MMFFPEALNTKRAQALIIAVFIMLVLALIGWTVVNFTAVDLEVSGRSLDSERALYLAETGIHWGLIELKSNFDCTGFDPPTGFLHDSGLGQYQISCTCTVGTPNCNNSPELILESTGYIPTQDSFRVQRQVKVTVTQGAFSKAGTVRNEFDWVGLDEGNSDIDGDLAAGCFNGDDIGGCPGDAADYGPNLPPGTGDRDQGITNIPDIDMDGGDGLGGYRARATTVWSAGATATVSNGSGGVDLKVQGAGIFDDTIDVKPEVVRIVGEGWGDDKWVVVNTRRNSGWVEVYLKPGVIDDMTAWEGKTVRVVKRFADNHNNQGLWYIVGTDALIDVRASNPAAPAAPNKECKMQKTSIIAEGDIFIVGTKRVRSDTYVDTSAHETFPNLATREGDIISETTPSMGSGGRKFTGLIYSYNGGVTFDCIDGVAIIADHVDLDNEIYLDYSGKYVDPYGFIGVGGVSLISWEEE